MASPEGPVIPRLLAISDRRLLGTRSLEDWLGALAGRADAVQLREKQLTDRELLEQALRTRDAAPRGLRVLINGRADVALASGCDGVHLPSDGVPIAALRRRFGDQLLIGCSTHHPGEVEAARRGGADYVVFGPVFPTPSKAPYGTPVGIEGLRRAARHGLPVLAIGGIGPREMAEAAGAGASGVAGIRAFHDSRDLEEMAAKGRRLWPRG
ncbi:MAG: thiamine phosphate synthase [bacterium]|nr:thiamine phosphate synthase [bacterium]